MVVSTASKHMPTFIYASVPERSRGGGIFLYSFTLVVKF
jgi:hypothetical protein